VTTVKMISSTENPVGTIYAVWQASRTEDVIHSAAEYERRAMGDRALWDDMQKTFREVLSMQLPCVEVLSFNFLIEDMSISLREHIVRHRIGHRFGPELGVDSIPGSVDSTFWGQSMRVKSMGDFARKDQFEMPDAIMECGEACHVYEHHMAQTERTYNKLLELGIQPEDARQVIPLGATHRMSWVMNLSAAISILSRRTCWIAQLGLWQPVVKGMIRELREIHPFLAELADPPCFNRKGEFTACSFVRENEARAAGEDPEPPCSLWLHKTGAGQTALHNSQWKGHATREQQCRYTRLKDQYGKLWGRNPITGAKTEDVDS